MDVKMIAINYHYQELTMYLKAICFVAAAMIFMTSSLEAQSFRTLGTRRGALVGGVIGGIIGGQNDEVAAGIIAGGLVGGVTGRVVGNRLDINQSRAYYQGYSQGYSQPTYQYVAPRQQYYTPQRSSCPYSRGW